jgi:Ricin-type beta-trefoil lectin domain
VIWSYGCNATSAQVWTLTGDGEFQLHGNLCLQPANKATTAGTGMVAGTCDGSVGQRWQLAAGGLIKQVPTGLCLTVPQNRTDNVQLTIDTCTGATGQKWTTP